MADKHGLIGSRDEVFRTKIRTSITKELPTEHNPFVAGQVYWQGVPVTDLQKERSFSQVIFLLSRGRLPEHAESVLFDQLLVAMANPGPRHPATRAAMAAAAGKTRSPHVLPIGLSVLGGEHGGALEVEAAMRFIRSNLSSDPEILSEKLQNELSQEDREGERVAPGFGTLHGSIDPVSLERLEVMHAARIGESALAWTLRFSRALEKAGCGILVTGVAAAVLLELGFHPRLGVGLFQLAGAVGLLAHAQELATSHYTAWPMLADDDYEYVEDDDEHA